MYFFKYCWDKGHIGDFQWEPFAKYFSTFRPNGRPAVDRV